VTEYRLFVKMLTPFFGDPPFRFTDERVIRYVNRFEEKCIG
jgi:hypothetical protein